MSGAKLRDRQIFQPVPAPVTIDAGVVEMTPPTPAPAPTAAEVVPSDAVLKVETKQPRPQQQNNKGGKK